MWKELVLMMMLGAASVASAVSITLTWEYEQGSDLATMFVVYKQEACVGPFVAVASVPVAQLTYNITGLVPGTTECWEVTARDAVGLESAPSNVLGFSVSQLPAAPSNLQGTLGP